MGVQPLWHLRRVDGRCHLATPSPIPSPSSHPSLTHPSPIPPLPSHHPRSLRRHPHYPRRRVETRLSSDSGSVVVVVLLDSWQTCSTRLWISVVVLHWFLERFILRFSGARVGDTWDNVQTQGQGTGGAHRSVNSNDSEPKTPIAPCVSLTETRKGTYEIPLAASIRTWPL